MVKMLAAYGSSMVMLQGVLGMFTMASASYPDLAGYEPLYDVIDYANIDLDYKEMETHLKEKHYKYVEDIYMLGANSGAYANFKVAPLIQAVYEGSLVSQAGTKATGYIKKSASAGDTSIEVVYTSTCKQGGTKLPDLSGCYAQTGTVSVNGTDVGEPVFVTNMYQSLAKLSTQSKAKMAGEEFYTEFYSYWDAGDYAHQYVLEAIRGSGRFSQLSDASRIEAIKKGTTNQHVWMASIGKMEEAIMNCDENSVRDWDAAVAYFVGSVAGSNPSANGIFPHRLGEKRCVNFGTCIAINGTRSKAIANVQVIDEFKKGQVAIATSRCVEAILHKRRIVAMMSVPIVQGALRYAYKTAELNGNDKAIAEGAAFAQAIFPRVAACNYSAAQLILRNMAPNATTPMVDGFLAVKEAFESVYLCLGITCEDIGGHLINAEEYYEKAEPCKITPGVQVKTVMQSCTPSEGVPILFMVILVVSIFGCVSMFCLALTFRQRSITSMMALKKAQLDLIDEVYEGEKTGGHLMFLSHFKREAGTEATLMREQLTNMVRKKKELLAWKMEAPIFLDSENLRNLAELGKHVEESMYLVLLLTSKVLLRPWCIIEIVTAYRSGVTVVPVEIQRPGSHFEYPQEQFFTDLGAGKVLDTSATELIEDLGISMEEVEMAVRNVFLQIALPFSPHKSKNIRAAELADILERCKNNVVDEDVQESAEVYQSFSSKSSIGSKVGSKVSITSSIGSKGSRNSNTKHAQVRTDRSPSKELGTPSSQENIGNAVAKDLGEHTTDTTFVNAVANDFEVTWKDVAVFIRDSVPFNHEETEI